MTTWIGRAKASAIGQLPARWRPQFTYHYRKLRNLLEPELAVARQWVRQGSCVVDVGANEGVYTHAFASAGARVEAFEPQPDCFSVLEKYARVTAAVRVYPVALSSYEGNGVLHVPLRTDGTPVHGWAALRTERELATTNGRRHAVEVRTLDSYELPDVALIKIDVEGAELDVLRGAAATIRRCRPILLIEVEQRHQCQPIGDVFAAIFAVAEGYDGRFFVRDRGLMPLSDFDVALHQSPAHADTPRATYINNFIFKPVP